MLGKMTEIYLAYVTAALMFLILARGVLLPRLLSVLCFSYVLVVVTMIIPYARILLCLLESVFSRFSDDPNSYLWHLRVLVPSIISLLQTITTEIVQKFTP
jgi:hypothetical protein